MRRPGLLTFFLLLISVVGILFLSLPILVLTLRGLLTPGAAASSITGIGAAVGLSLLTTAASALVTLLFGTPLAYILARWRFPFKRLVTVLVELPIVLPPAVAGLALLVTWGRRGTFGPLLEAAHITLPFTTSAVVLAQLFVSAPFYIRAAQIGFQAIPSEIEDAGRVDGAAGLDLFRTITLPLAGRALAAGLTLSWARALGEFGATILFAGSLSGRTQTMPLLIYNVLESSLDTAIWTSLILIGLALLALLLAQRLNRDGDLTSPSI